MVCSGVDICVSCVDTNSLFIRGLGLVVIGLIASHLCDGGHFVVHFDHCVRSAIIIGPVDPRLIIR